MKIAPLIRRLKGNENFEIKLVHTGQHYDYEMSQGFFKDLDIPNPNINLNVGSNSHGAQTGLCLIRFEHLLKKWEPDLVIVVGDVNTTLSCALAAQKLHIKVAHIEAGLRTYDKSAPEEVNRLLTDHISDYLFVTEKVAIDNLYSENVREGVHLVGNTMIDNMLDHMDKIDACQIMKSDNELDFLKAGNDKYYGYCFMTLHRPHNVDKKEKLIEIYEQIKKISNEYCIVFPIHPRTHKSIIQFGLDDKFYGNPNICVMNPVSYIECMYLVKNSEFVITDSGGLQPETSFLKIPCFSLNKETPHPVTITYGTNNVVKEIENLYDYIKSMNFDSYKNEEIPFWDGKTSDRIIDVLESK